MLLDIVSKPLPQGLTPLIPSFGAFGHVGRKRIHLSNYSVTLHTLNGNICVVS